MGNIVKQIGYWNKLFQNTEVSPKLSGLFSFLQKVIFRLKVTSWLPISLKISLNLTPKAIAFRKLALKPAKSYYFQSPRFSLDQEDSYTAIEKLQVFLNLYPNSEFAVEANQMISELQEKLEQKDFEIAKQYFTIRDYKAAIKANENFVSSFPGTKFREESLYTKFIASFEIAINSIDSKKKERLEELIQQYNTIIRYYPESLFLEDLDKRMTQVNQDLDQFNQDSSQQTK
jgi:outer membrane protein assembly factor BamD